MNVTMKLLFVSYLKAINAEEEEAAEAEKAVVAVELKEERF